MNITKNIICLFAVVLLLFTLLGCTSKETSDAQNYMSSIEPKLLLAADKESRGDVNSALSIYTEIQTGLENYLYDQKVDTNTRENVRIKREEIIAKITSINSNKSNSGKLSDYESTYATLLSQEKDLTKEYKYNPTIINEIGEKGTYVEHCANTKGKVVDLKNKFTALKNNVSSIVPSNEQVQSLLEKVTKSTDLFNAMALDYDNWCETRQINSDIQKFSSGLDKNAADYGKTYFCTYIKYGEKLVQLEEKRTQFFKSTDFLTLKNLIKEKTYPWDPVLDTITNSNVDIAKFALEEANSKCDFFTRLQEYTVLETNTKTKYLHYDDRISTADKAELVSKIKAIYTDCLPILALQTGCQDLLTKYPDDTKTWLCEYDQINCTFYKLNYEKIESGKASTYVDIFGYN